MKKIKYLQYIFTSLLSALILSAAAQKEILLWPNGAPGSEGKTGEEKISTSARGEISISNVHHPSITPYFVTKEKATVIMKLMDEDKDITGFNQVKGKLGAEYSFGEIRAVFNFRLRMEEAMLKPY